MTDPYEDTFEAAVARFTQGLNDFKRALLNAFGGEVEQLTYELTIITGRVPGSLGRVIRLHHSQRWAIAGRWLITDEQITQPRNWRERLLASMASDVRDGRLLAEAGF